MQGYNKDRIGYQRLLLGRKGVGKTTFLKCVQNVAKNLYPDNLITIYCDYSSSKIFPSRLISNALKNKNKVQYFNTIIQHFIRDAICLKDAEKLLEKKTKICIFGSR